MLAKMVSSHFNCNSVSLEPDTVFTRSRSKRTNGREDDGFFAVYASRSSGVVRTSIVPYLPIELKSMGLASNRHVAVYKSYKAVNVQWDFGVAPVIAVLLSLLLDSSPGISARAGFALGKSTLHHS